LNPYKIPLILSLVFTNFSSNFGPPLPISKVGGKGLDWW